MKYHCVILDDYQNVALSLADWSRLANRLEIEVFNHHLSDEEALVDAIHQADIVVMMRERTPFPASVLNRLPNLKLLVTTGMRNASVDLAAATSHGIVVSGTEGSSQATSELAFTLILGLAKGLMVESGSLRTNGPWQSTLSTDLQGSTLGILGLGRIGQQVARMGQAFGMNILAWSQNLTADRAETVGVQFASSKEALLADSDFVTIHLVLSDRTRGLIGEPELRLMKPTSYLINTSRSGIVDQTALRVALEEGWIAGAGLDVFDTEPLPPDHPFRLLPNVLATPHIGYVSKNTYQTWFPQIVEDIEAFVSGAPIRQLNG